MPTEQPRGTRAGGARRRRAAQPQAQGDEAARMAALAVDDLAQQLGIPASDIEVREVRAVTWPDSSLGCPEPGMMYAQAEQDGYLIRLSARGEIYHYHSGGGQAPFLCEQTAATAGARPARDRRNSSRRPVLTRKRRTRRRATSGKLTCRADGAGPQPSVLAQSADRGDPLRKVRRRRANPWKTLRSLTPPYNSLRTRQTGIDPTVQGSPNRIGCLPRGVASGRLASSARSGILTALSCCVSPEERPAGGTRRLCPSTFHSIGGPARTSICAGPRAISAGVPRRPTPKPRPPSSFPTKPFPYTGPSYAVYDDAPDAGASPVRDGERALTLFVLRAMAALVFVLLAAGGAPTSPERVDRLTIERELSVVLEMDDAAWRARDREGHAALIDPDVGRAWAREWREGWGASAVSGRVHATKLGPAHRIDDGLVQAQVYVSTPRTNWWQAEDLRETRFYREANGMWLRTAPPDSYWGEPLTLHTDSFRLPVSRARRRQASKPSPHSWTMPTPSCIGRLGLGALSRRRADPGARAAGSAPLWEFE